MWGFNRYGGFFVLLLVIALFFLFTSGRNTPVWLCFCVVPVFPLAFRMNSGEKRKRDEKLKRDEPRYTLGDDGELVELPPDVADARRPDDLV